MSPTKQKPKVLYACHEGPQGEFQASEAQELLYGGAAGGGKSYALRAWAVRYCMEYPGAQVALFRRTYKQLEDTHVVALRTEVPEAVAHYAPGSHNLEFTNGSVLMLRYCEKEDDARNYDTAEFDALLFDELTHFTQFQYTYILSRCRSTKPWWPGRRIRAAATPLGVGHNWVKARWVDAKDENAKPIIPSQIWQAPVSEGGMKRQFIPARVTDNPTLMKADPDYMTLLRALPDEEYRAKALGDWDVFTGQFFKRWRPEIHMCEPFDIPPDWDKWICVDYGYSAPYAVLWFARPPQTDSVYFYREHYGISIPLKEQAYRAFIATREAAETIRAVILDPSMFNKVNVKGERIDSMSVEWANHFGGTSKVIRGNNERVPGWRTIRELLDWKEAPNGSILVPPRMHIFNNCSNLSRTLPLLVTDDHNVEDVDSAGEDHAPDAIRYGLRHVFAGAGQAGRSVKYTIGANGVRAVARVS